MSFGFWGVGDILRRIVTPTNAPLVEGRGVSIDHQLFAQTWQRATAPFRAQGLSNEQLLAGALPHLLLERLVARALLQKESKRLEITVPPSVLRKVLADNPLFAGEDGNFAGWQFASFLRESGLSEEAYLEELGSNLIEASLLDNLSFGVSLPESFIRYLLAGQLEQRSLEILRVPAIRPSSIRDPGDKKLQDFMREEESLFRLSEYRKFSFLVIRPIVADRVSDSTLRAEYEARRESLTSPELRSYSQLFFEEESPARKVMESYRGSEEGAGKTLQQAARAGASNAPISTPISLLKQSREDILDEAIADGVFSLGSVGDVALIEGSLGWYVIRLDGLLPSRLASFDDLRGELAKLIALEQASEQYEKDIAQAEDMILTGALLEEIAEGVGGKIEETLLIDGQGQIKRGINETGSFDQNLKKLSLSERDEAALLELGFSLSSIGEVASGLEILGEGDTTSPTTSPRIILLSLQELQEPRLATLGASNRERVLSIYRGLNVDKQVLARTNEIADSARLDSSSSASPLSAVARKEGLALQRAMVTRDAKDWQSGFLEAIFIAQIGDVLTTFSDNQNAHLVVRLSGISRPRLQSLTDKEVAAFTKEVGEDRELPLAVYQQVLESRADLEINEESFKSFISPSGSREGNLQEATQGFNQ